MSAEREPVPAFLKALHGHIPPGLIEVRLIEDQRGGQLRDRTWYESPEALAAHLDRLNGLSAQHGAGVFFGVLPRAERGRGESKDTIPGLVAWADLDFKDFPGGEQEARERLKEFPLPPSIIVRSGHGLHVYWILREATEPGEISDLARRLARVLGADHAFDAARILRLPGTCNRKDADSPIPVSIELLEPDRTYNPSDIEEALDLIGEPAPPTSTPRPGSDGPLDPRILALLDKNARIRALFDGTGKPALRSDGRPLDRSTSGYDYSLCLALVGKGISDPSLLDNALRNRPDGGAKRKGRGYRARTIAKVLKRAEESDAQTVECDFKVEKARVFGSDPPVFELTIDGNVLRLSSTQLSAPSSFSLAFVNTMRRIPSLPAKKNWPDVVNAWLAGAETVDQPPEASDEPALREAVLSAVENLPTGTERMDLDHGKGLELPGGVTIFKVEAILRALREDFPALRRHELCRVLRDLGFGHGVHTVDGKATRAWSYTPSTRAKES